MLIVLSVQTAVNFDAVAIYRNTLAGAIAGVCGWCIARWTLGPFPAMEFWIATTQGAIIGLSLAVAMGLTYGDSFWTDQHRWLRRVGLHAVAGLVVGAIAAMIGLWLQLIIGGLLASTFAWVALCTAIGATSGWIQWNAARSARSALAGLIAGLIGGSTLEVLFVAFQASDIQTDLATTMAGVYGLGLIGSLLCALDQVVDEIFRTAWLVIETGDGAGRGTTLDTRSKPLEIGSARDCHICLSGDGTVAPHHAAVSREEADYVVEAVDGVTFAGAASEAPSPIGRAALEDGGEICVGTQRIRFREFKVEA